MRDAETSPVCTSPPLLRSPFKHFDYLYVFPFQIFIFTVRNELIGVSSEAEFDYTIAVTDELVPFKEVAIS